jgi:uracil-DNA glycosylase family 4
VNRQQRSQELRRLARGIRGCHKCRLCTGRTNAVPGEGDDDADVMLVGEGPGEVEDSQGRPFVGQSGRFLDGLLSEVGLPRELLLLTSSVKCRPPKNRTPRLDEIQTCRKAWLERQIVCVQPRWIVLLGRAAIRCV